MIHPGLGLTIGRFVADEFHGVVTEIWFNGDRAVSNFYNGSLQGDQKIINKYGVVRWQRPEL